MIIQLKKIQSKKKKKRKKKDHTTKIGEIENKFTTDHDHYKYITTQEFNKLTVENLLHDQHKQIQLAKMILLEILLNISVVLLELICGNVMECQKKILAI